MGGNHVAPMPPATDATADEHLLAIMDRIEYRRIVSPEDLEDVGSLRQRAWNRHPLYVGEFNGPVIEDLDLQGDTYLFGLYHDGTLVSSMRLNVLKAGMPETPAMEYFSDVLSPLLAQGMVFVDPSRFAIDTEASKVLPALPLLTHRLSTMMTVHLGANHCLCAVKMEHEAYYRRVFRATRFAGPVTPEGVLVNVVLLGIAGTNYDYITRRNPLFNFTETEARLMFDNRPGAMRPLSVLPTARLALRKAA